MKGVFISYVSENIEIVDRLYQELKSHGIEVWRDRDNIALGLRWKREIRQAIQQGAFIIACFSKEYHERDRTYMNEELTIAIEELRQRPTSRAWFIPVKLNDCEIPDRDIGGGETLCDLQLNLYEDWDGCIRRILEVIQPASSETATNAHTSDHRVDENARAEFSEDLTQILERIEKRRQPLFRANEPTLTMVICPILSNRPLISTADIYGFARENGLWGDYSSRVTGGVAGGFVSPIKMDSYSSNYWEFNEYGIVYHSDVLVRKKSWVTDNAKQFHDCLHFPAFVWTIGNSVNRAQSFYRKCKYVEHIEITARLQQVSGERLLYYDQYPKEDIERQRSADPEISASTRYFPRNLEQAEQFVNVIDELVDQILWTFNIADDQRREKVEGLLRKSAIVELNYAIMAKILL